MKEYQKVCIIVIGIILIILVVNFSNYSSISAVGVNKVNLSCTSCSESCSEKECDAGICSPQFGLNIDKMNVQCSLDEKDCKCAVNNYFAFTQGFGVDSDLFNPTANEYKTYTNLANFLDINNPPKINVNFIQNEMQYYEDGQINVWKNDPYGQAHETLHFILRSYTQPQDGWYPYLEEGMAHYGAYCYNNPNTQRCNTDLGNNYVDPSICTPGNGTCKGQVADTSLILELRKDYNCDWTHCWKNFLEWAISRGGDLTLKDATTELNSLTGKDIRPLLNEYGVNEANYPSFVISQQNKITEENIINSQGYFSTL